VSDFYEQRALDALHTQPLDEEFARKIAKEITSELQRLGVVARSHGGNTYNVIRHKLNSVFAAYDMNPANGAEAVVTSDETQYLLAQLSEECNEVAQRCIKAIRFGLDETEPGQGNDNRTRIEFEIVDMIGVIELLMERGALDISILSGELHRDDINMKKAKVRKYMDYARSLRQLE
jgi:hypothetical protein